MFTQKNLLTGPPVKSIVYSVGTLTRSAERDIDEIDVIEVIGYRAIPLL